MKFIYLLRLFHFENFMLHYSILPYSVKRNFFRFLKDNDAYFSYVKTVTKFNVSIESLKPNQLIISAFDWSKVREINWMHLHKTWLNNIK